MDFVQMYICMILLVQFGWNQRIFDQTSTAYNIGVYNGIFNPSTYTFQSFKKDEPALKKAYKKAVPLMGVYKLSYLHWLVKINYELPDGTQDKKKKALRKHQQTSAKNRFMRTVRTGDILISTKNSRGLIGHAALMVSDYWVLEMRGGKKWRKGTRGNNRQISKSDWFNDYGYEWTTVFRCPDSSVAEQAAYWADRAYFNPNGGQDKTIYVTYKITPDFATTDPSYSSKLVLQAYYYGASGVIDDVTKYGPVIAPSRIPSYFMSPYKLQKIGKF